MTYQNDISRYATNVSYVESNTGNNGTTAKPMAPPENGTPAPSPPPARPGAGTRASLQ